MWRKTRRPVESCIGSDANRNFDDQHWSQNGTSSRCYADTYPGDKAFSEPESQVIRNVLEEIKETCKFYFTMHSFGQMLLYSYGHTYDKPETWKDLDEVAKAGADAIKSYKGTTYRYGTIANVIYPASGSSVDYAFIVAKIPIAIAIELPGGVYGFNPPAKEIENYAKESSIGIFAMIKKVAEKYS